MTLTLAQETVERTGPALEEPPAPAPEATPETPTASPEVTPSAVDGPAPAPDAAPEAPPFDFNDPAAYQDLFWAYGPSVITVIVILVAAFIVAGFVGRAVRSGLKKAKLEDTLAIFIGRAARWAILLLAVVLCMSEFGVDTTSIAALVAGIGFAIALGFQGTLGSLAAGVLLMAFRPYKVGDVVKLDGELGKVAEIELFTTLIDTFDNRRIILPNANVFGNKIENLSFHPIRRAEVLVGTSYDADIDETRKVLKQAVDKVPGRLDEPEPAVALLELGDSSVNWAVRAWANSADLLTVKDALTREVKVHLDQAGIEIPYPQMDLHMDRKK